MNTGAAATCNTVSSHRHHAFQPAVWLMYYAAMFVKVIVKPRALMAFAIVITELAFGIFILFVAFVSGGLLLPRVWRLQRYGSPTARAPVEEYVSRSPRGARRPPSAWGPRDHPSQTRRPGREHPGRPQAAGHPASTSPRRPLRRRSRPR